jgi:hypothetical protein
MKCRGGCEKETVGTLRRIGEYAYALDDGIDHPETDSTGYEVDAAGTFKG